ncbi:MAG TPA: tetratricopeptide repeat protein [Candidatus Sulfotelmatobacter sp.]|nr:tetratricopeptide repeat protein [Candidatus Sulfotelmatobacter sp.]
MGTRRPGAIYALILAMRVRSAVRRFASCLGLMLICLSAGFAAQSTPPAQKEGSTNSDFASARKLMQLGKIDEAIVELQSIEVRDPSTNGLAFELGTAYYKKADYPKAVEYLKKATAADPSNNEATQLLGLSHYLMGHPADAIPLLEKVQGWYPRANVDAAYILGICYIQMKNYDQARKSFGKMFDVPPDSAAAYLFTARMLLRQEYDPIAEEYAQKAAALDPKLPLAHFLLGELYTYKSRVSEAIAEFQKELAINPANAAAYYKLADAYSRVQKYDEAERLLQRSIWLDATTTGPYILMGKVLEKKGEFDLAVRALQRAAAMDPNNATTHHLLGQAYRDMGRKDEAENELKIAEELRTQSKN